MSTNRTQRVVETQMHATLADLALAGLAIQQHLDVADDGTRMVDRGEGIDASQYLRELVVETKTVEDGSFTDFMLTIGGPTIWVRSFVATDEAFIYGTTASFPEPIRWSIDSERHPEAFCAVALLLDYGFMDEGRSESSWMERMPF